MSFAAVAVAAAAVAEGVAAAAAAASAAAASASAAVAGTVASAATAVGVAPAAAATIGSTVAGAAQGAVTGAALGAGTSAATGSDVGTGALYGAAGGALTGGASGALEGAGGAEAGTAAGSSTSAAPAAGSEVAGEGLYGGVAKEGGTASAKAVGYKAIDPAFESSTGQAATTHGIGSAETGGNTTGSLISSKPISPGFESGAYQGIDGASGPGMLGTAGTNAADISTGQGAINPGFSSMGAMDQPNPVVESAKNMYRINSNSNDIRQLSGDSPADAERNNAVVNAQASELAQNSLNSIAPYQDDPRNRISNQIFMNNWNRI